MKVPWPYFTLWQNSFLVGFELFTSLFKNFPLLCCPTWCHQCIAGVQEFLHVPVQSGSAHDKWYGHVCTSGAVNSGYPRFFFKRKQTMACTLLSEVLRKTHKPCRLCHTTRLPSTPIHVGVLAGLAQQLLAVAWLHSGCNNPLSAFPFNWIFDWPYETVKGLATLADYYLSLQLMNQLMHGNQSLNWCSTPAGALLLYKSAPAVPVCLAVPQQKDSLKDPGR